MSETIASRQNELTKMINRYAKTDGVHTTAIPSLFSYETLMHSFRAMEYINLPFA